MTAKEYLEQAQQLDQLINSYIQEKEELRKMACSLSSPKLSLGKVQSSRTHEAPYERTLEKVWDLEEQISKEIDHFVDVKNEIRTVIRQVSNTDQQVILRMRYIHFLSWEEIADALGFTVRWTLSLHGKALKAVQKILDKEAA